MAPAILGGGEVDQGFAEVILLAIDERILTLAATDVDRHSTETVMERYKIFQNRNAVIAVDVEQEINIGTHTNVGPSVFQFDTSRQNTLVIGGIKLTILSVQPYSVQYIVDDVMPMNAK